MYTYMGYPLCLSSFGGLRVIYNMQELACWGFCRQVTLSNFPSNPLNLAQIRCELSSQERALVLFCLNALEYNLQERALVFFCLNALELSSQERALVSPVMRPEG